MADFIARAPFSYKDDPALSGFDDSGPVVFMDGDCALCSFGARMIARLDHKALFKICPVTSPTGRAVLEHYGLEPEHPESWLFLENGIAYGGLDAIIRVGARLGGIGFVLYPLKILPGAVQRWIYRRIARNRYALFGRSDMCSLPDPALRARLIE